MKKLLYLLIFFAGILNAQIVDIPDPNFKYFLTQGEATYDSNQDGEIQVSEALAITSLNVEGWNISDLTGISSFTNLISLNCRYNELTELDLSANINLTSLQCETNNISTLDFSNLNNLYLVVCYDNPLTSLIFSDNNPDLYWLEVGDELTSLEINNCPSLSRLDCSYNELTSLSLSNVNVTNLYCQNNQLVDIDLSGVNEIQSANFEGNPIETINLKNGVLDNIESIFETSILGSSSPLEFICADEDEIEGIMNYLNSIGNSNVVVQSYCSFEPGGTYNTISGSVLLDTDNNGCDITDLPISNSTMRIDDGTTQSYAYINNSGNYNFYFQEGTFTLTPNIENPDWYTINPSTATHTFADSDNNSVTQDFCVTANGVHSDIEIVLVPIVAAQPGFDATYQLVYKNKGNQTVSGSVSFDYDDTVLDYILASISPDSQATGNASWNYTDLLPFESRSIGITLNVNSPMETPAVNIDDQLDFSASVSPIAGDATPVDNTFGYKQIVVGSFDPNDITCLEGDTVNPDQIGEYLHYNINFENTGTAPATFVVVKDIIDEVGYDMSSFQIMYASHPMQTRITNNTVEFIFDNINLGPNEKGNVVFKIKTNDTLIVGDSVENDAEIFFDYNFPIETNIATTSYQVLSIDEFNTDNSISVFPNPAKALVNIVASNIIESIEVYDIQGRRVSTKLNDSQVASIDISDLLGGIYFLKIKSEFGYKVERLIKN